MRIIAIVLGVLGGIVGLVSAITAFVAVGGEAAYSARLWAGWAALLLALAATAAAVLISNRPTLASLAMLISGILGFVCINLFYINTFYVVAVPLWIVATALALISARVPTSSR
jgi:hypothetical protein